jgi:type IV pilus assembly protein PilA
MSTLNSRLQLSILNRKKDKDLIEEGFTLVELMIVIVVVGVLSAVALPNFLGVKVKAEAGAEIGQFVGLAKECSSAILIDGPFPADYPDEIVGAGAGKVTIDCNNGSGEAPGTNVVFTSTVVPTELNEAVKCGPALKIEATKSCVVTVDTKGGIGFTST